MIRKRRTKRAAGLNSHARPNGGAESRNSRRREPPTSGTLARVKLCDPAHTALESWGWIVPRLSYEICAHMR